jgi:hypothetical protein
MKNNWIVVVFIAALLVLTACGSWAGNLQSSATKDSNTDLKMTSVNIRKAWTQALYDWTLRHVGYAGICLDNQDSTAVQVVPEASTVIGFGAALVLNGLGAAGTSYYLRRKYNRENAKRYAFRHADRLSMFVDTAASILVLLAIGPVLLVVATASALKPGLPKVYGR